MLPLAPSKETIAKKRHIIRKIFENHQQPIPYKVYPNKYKVNINS